MAVVQPEKMQPVLNLSTSENHYLKDDLKAKKIPKNFLGQQQKYF
jgi:hypothetical protein